jgi:hypothetical protein
MTDNTAGWSSVLRGRDHESLRMSYATVIGVSSFTNRERLLTAGALLV